MSDDPLNGIPSFDRVSIRAVLVEDGEDPGQALVEAGIFDPVAIRVSLGDDQPDNTFGDGFTDNLTGVLESDPDHEFDPGSGTPPAQASSASEQGPSTDPKSANLPGAFGLRPLAPVRKRGL